MNFEDFNELVQKVKSDHPIWFGIEPDEIPDDTTIRLAEEKLYTQLPDDYINFILEYGGGYFAFSNVFSLQERSDFNLVYLNYKYDAVDSGYVLFSENNSGDIFGFKTVDGICEPKIHFYDHEIEIWQESQYCNLFDYLEKVALSN